MPSTQRKPPVRSLQAEGNLPKLPEKGPEPISTIEPEFKTAIFYWPDDGSPISLVEDFQPESQAIGEN